MACSNILYVAPSFVENIMNCCTQPQSVETDSTSDDIEAELARMSKPKKPTNLKVTKMK